LLSQYVVRPHRSSWPGRAVAAAETAKGIDVYRRNKRSILDRLEEEA